MCAHKAKFPALPKMYAFQPPLTRYCYRPFTPLSRLLCTAVLSPELRAPQPPFLVRVDGAGCGYFSFVLFCQVRDEIVVRRRKSKSDSVSDDDAEVN